MPLILFWIGLAIGSSVTFYSPNESVTISTAVSSGYLVPYPSSCGDGDVTQYPVTSCTSSSCTFLTPIFPEGKWYFCGNPSSTEISSFILLHKKGYQKIFGIEDEYSYAWTLKETVTALDVGDYGGVSVLIIGDFTGVVHVWSLETHAVLYTYNHRIPMIGLANNRYTMNDRITYVSYHESLIVSAGGDGRICFFDVFLGKVGEITFPYEIKSMVWNSNNVLAIISVPGIIRLYDFSGYFASQIFPSTTMLDEYSAKCRITGAVFIPNNRLAISCLHGRIYRYTLTYPAITTPTRYEIDFNIYSLGVYGSNLITVDTQNYIRSWNTQGVTSVIGILSDSSDPVNMKIRNGYCYIRNMGNNIYVYDLSWTTGYWKYYDLDLDRKTQENPILANTKDFQFKFEDTFEFQTISVNVKLPVYFTAIKGNFTLNSVYSNGVYYDCRPGTTEYGYVRLSTDKSDILYNACSGESFISIPETTVSYTNTLIFTVSQSNLLNSLKITNMNFDVFVDPKQPVRVIRLTKGDMTPWRSSVKDLWPVFDFQVYNGFLIAADLTRIKFTDVSFLYLKINIGTSLDISNSVSSLQSVACNLNTAFSMTLATTEGVSSGAVSVSIKTGSKFCDGSTTLSTAVTVSKSGWIVSGNPTVPGEFLICAKRAGYDLKPIGVFTVRGPSGVNLFTCIFGSLCEFFLNGYGLSDGDHLGVVDGNTCNNPSFVTAFPYQGKLQARGNGYYYKTERNVNTPLVVDDVSLTGATFTLCWCPSNKDCSLNTNFGVTAGKLVLAKFTSPYTVTCTVGVPCMYTMDSNSGPVIVGDSFMAKTDSCATGTSNVAVTDTTNFSFGTAITETGTYNVCWCQGSEKDCSSSSDYTVSAGTLTVSADTVSYPTNCGTSFTGWRTWHSYADCCCNYLEAGVSGGCENTSSEVYTQCASYLN
jgi:hypothetical protein